MLGNTCFANDKSKLGRDCDYKHPNEWVNI